MDQRNVTFRGVIEKARWMYLISCKELQSGNCTEDEALMYRGQMRALCNLGLVSQKDLMLFDCIYKNTDFKEERKSCRKK